MVSRTAYNNQHASRSTVFDRQLWACQSEATAPRGWRSTVLGNAPLGLFCTSMAADTSLLALQVSTLRT